MAKLNPFLGDLRGKAAGNVFSRNRFGPYLRTKVTPVNPQTNPQNVARGALAASSSSWSSALTDAVRQGWRDYAVTVPLTDAFGNTYFMTGHQAYVRTRTFRLNAGLPFSTGAPVGGGEAPTPYWTDPAGTTISDSASATANTLTIDITDIAGSQAAVDSAGVAVYVSAMLNPGVTFPPRYRRFVGSWLGDSVTPPTSFAVDLGFNVVAGMVFFVSLRGSDAEKRISPYNMLRVIATNIP